jgi:hypothetical protein
MTFAATRLADLEDKGGRSRTCMYLGTTSCTQAACHMVATAVNWWIHIYWSSRRNAPGVYKREQSNAGASTELWGSNRVCCAYTHCKSGLKKYTPERYRTIDAAITGRYIIPCLSKAQIKRDNLQA